MKIILSLLLLLSAAVLFTGCKSTTFVHTAADGTIIKASDRRFFMRTEADITGSVLASGDRQISAKVKSDSNAEALKAVAEGVATGLAKGVKP